jgi:hypothetical protein
MCPFLKLRLPPLDVQAASYLAASVRILSFSRTSMMCLIVGRCTTAARTAGRTLNGINKAEHLCGQKSHAYEYEKHTPTSHFEFLLTK